MDFQDGSYAIHLGLPIGMILATFGPQILPMLPSKVWVNGLFGSGDHLGFSIKRILAIFDLQAAAILPSKFQVNWPSLSGVQNRFSKG